MKSFTSHALAAIIGAAIVAAACAYYNLRQSLPSILAQPAKELKNAKTETLKCKPVIVYQDKVKSTLGLPEAVTKSPDKKVTASTKVDASDYPTTVTSVYDTGTGATDMYKRQDRLPWLGTARRTAVGLFWGAQDDGTTTTRLSATYVALQVKRINLGITGDVSTSGRAFIGVGGEIRF